MQPDSNSVTKTKDLEQSVAGTGHCSAPRGLLKIGKLQHSWGSRTLLMGIINLTPDSFSGDGLLNAEEIVRKAGQHIEQGADILDLGGESTRPGHSPVTLAEEKARVIPALSQISASFPDFPLSLDTTKAELVRESAGIHMLNSVQGLTDDLLQVALEKQLPVVIMHNKEKAYYEGDVMDEVLRYLESCAIKAIAAGMKKEEIILDPGIGFGKLPEHSIRVMNQLHRLVKLGFPTLVGTSRKSFIGAITGKSVDDRIFGTAASVALSVAAGIDIVRVHDIAACRDVIAVSDAIVRGQTVG